VRVYSTKEFMRFARRADIDDRELCAAARRAGRGLIDADLRAGLIKQRIPLKGQGRSGGFRTLAAFRQNHRCVFLYGFPKNERDNISDRELAHWRKVSAAYLQMTRENLAELADVDEMREVICED
jgi:hypothetical protein